MEKIKVGIVGGAGYTGGELIRILVNHPSVELTQISSESQNGNDIGLTHQDLSYLDLKFVGELDLQKLDCIFLCMGHGQSSKYLNKISDFPPKLKVIDLSHDFRHFSDCDFNKGKFVYGIPEKNLLKIQKAKYIANPGCFATSINLALLPIAKDVKSDIHITGITGSTGAGQSLSTTSHFSWREGNISSYKVFEHQHLKEISETIFDSNTPLKEIYFTPIRGNFTRGIFSTIYFKIDLSYEKCYQKYESLYENHPFVHITKNNVNLKQVKNTNFCFLSIQEKKGMIFITSAIDNLLKGASGQAVQNFNLIFGLNQKEGLNLKASYF